MKNALYSLLFLLLLGCSDTPSHHQVTTMITKAISTPNFYTVENVKKLNGWQEGDYYVTEAQYDIVFTTSLKQITQEIEKESKDNFFAGMLGMGGLLALKVNFGDFNKGDTINVQKTFYFIETEQGWRLSHKN